MTSELFAYVMLPGQTSFVTAGRFELSTDAVGNPLGRFVYGRSYLERADAVAFDPMDLKLEARTFETRRLKGLLGALRDASPDYWGRRVIEKHAGVAALGDLGRRASAQNFVSQCPRFLLTPEEARKIIDDMEEIVRARWYDVARREGVSERDCKTLSRCFAYDGFRLTA